MAAPTGPQRCRTPPASPHGEHRSPREPPLPLQEQSARATAHTDQLEDERLGKPTALAVFASDNLSSAAYATEEILHTLLIAGVGIIAFS